MSRFPSRSCNIFKSFLIAIISLSEETKKCPEPTIPEYAFVGRSNVGKSSLINMMMDKKQLAKVSQSPGKTRLINHFLINSTWYLVDLPGYGYAKVSKSDRQVFTKMIKDYVERRENLMCLFVLIDSRHEPQKLDLEFLRYLGEAEVPFAIVFTKSDKQSAKILDKKIELYKNELLKEWEVLPEIFMTSAVKKTGSKEILSYINNINPLFNS